MRIETVSVFNEQEFDELYYSKFNQTKASDLNSVGLDHYYYDVETNTVAFNLGTASSVGSVRARFDRLTRGDNFIVTGKIKCQTASGTFNLMVSEIDNNGTIFESSLTKNVKVNNTGWTEFSELLPFRQTTIATAALVSVGSVKSANGQGLMMLRDVKIELQSSIGSSRPSSNFSKTLMGAAWYHNGVWAKRTDFPDTGFSISTTTNTVVITFNETLSKRPCVNIGDHYMVNGKNKRPVIYDITTSGFEFAYLDATGDIIPTASYKNDHYAVWSANV